MPPDDVVIAGAGPAGALAALLLARRGARVTLVDRSRFPRPKLCGDTLNPGAVALLARHVAIDDLAARSLRLHGMRLTGPGGAAVRGSYGDGRYGLAVTRDVFDAWLLGRALAAGARLVDDTVVLGPVVDARGRVSGVTTRSRSGIAGARRARVTIGADGRRSRLASALRLSHLAARPRRWAIGARFSGVADLEPVGEMHIRTGHYVGVAPLPDGLANACLVIPFSRGAFGRDPGALLDARIASDPLLAERFCGARRITAPHVLGPMAVETPVPGCAGLLLAGDAAGFVDPMTGDGIRLALAGAELAAAVAADTIDGHVGLEEAPRHLAALARRRLAGKRRFNRVVRRIVASPAAIRAGTLVARRHPALFAALIRHAGDCWVTSTEMARLSDRGIADCRAIGD
jgi:flavin-dependent dehydrogenase